MTGLLGAIGGILGVYLGFSFIAIFELVEVISRGILCRGHKKKEVKASPAEKITNQSSKVHTVSKTTTKKGY